MKKNHIGFIRELLERFDTEHADKTAFSIRNREDDRDISFRDFCRDIRRAAAWFRVQDITGQNIAMISEGDYWFYVALFGAMASGNAVAMLNPELPTDMLDTLCKKTDVTVAYTTPSVLEEIEGKVAIRQWILPDMLTREEPIPLDQVHNSPDDETILLIFTSGTTGVSKAAEITSRNFQANVKWGDWLYTIPHGDRAYYAVPRYHIAGLHFTTICLNRGNTLFLGRGVRYLSSDLATFNPSFIVMVPAMAANLVRLLKKTPDKSKWAKYVGTNWKRVALLGASVAPSLIRDLQELGILIDVGYGMTETCACITAGLLRDDKPGSVGQACTGVEIKIENGEILVRSPGVMKGYYKQPEETAKILIDGWIHTGDAGRVDEDGYYFLTGRIKNTIILSNGENVSPEEIERKLSFCDAVLECMVYGDGKGICADVYTQQPEAVAAFVRSYNDEVPMYRQVYKVNYSAEPLEKTGSGKIKRKENVYV